MKMVYSRIVLATMFFISSCANTHDPEQRTHERDETSETFQSVTLTHKQREAARINVETARMEKLNESVKLPARIDFNQQRLAHITSRVPGRVEEAYAFVGDRVRQNELLATIYSQQYLTAQGELIQAHRRLIQSEGRRDSAEIPTARSIYESARRRLLVLGATEAVIEELVQTQIPKTYLEIRAPFAGSVIEANDILGHFVDVGSVLFHLADLSTVWVIADVYEKDLAKIGVGDPAVVEVAAYPNEKFHGRLTRMYDVLDEKTRSMKARIEVRNPEGRLKPQMYASVTLPLTSVKDAVVLPARALQLEGERRVVFVAETDSTFAKRYVTVGRQLDGVVEITEGIRPGERIVTDGAFIVKSEFQKSELSEE